VRRKLLILGLLLFVVAAGVIAWTLAGLPPPKYILRYGLSPGCEPTGETVTLEGVEFVEIGPGIFRMGSTKLAKGGDWLGRICAPLGLPWGEWPEPSDEMPVHWVEFPRGFWIARTEVTNSQYEHFDPGHERSEYSEGDTHPVVNVSFSDVENYCVWLATRSGRPVRLPSEAEWECACRAGSQAEYCFGDDEDELGEYAWFGGEFQAGSHPVAHCRPNAWGLFDMHGNVWERCEDVYHRGYDGAPDDGSARKAPELPVESFQTNRVKRGGSWNYHFSCCRSAQRHFDYFDDGWSCLGFRPVFTTPPEE
jgi:formylglycine-generating enzyme required for sulfatase activity